MHPPECGVGEHVLTSAFLPVINNFLVVAISHEWCVGLVESE